MICLRRHPSSGAAEQTLHTLQTSLRLKIRAKSADLSTSVSDTSLSHDTRQGQPEQALLIGIQNKYQAR